MNTSTLELREAILSAFSASHEAGYAVGAYVYGTPGEREAALSRMGATQAAQSDAQTAVWVALAELEHRIRTTA